MPERTALTPSESNYPLPSQGQVLEITPEMASDWLSTRRWPNQRNMSVSIVAKYLKDMKEGRWKLTRQGLIFTADGYNIDGQHRLRALANMQDEELSAAYGTPWLPFWVYPDEPLDTFETYDQNYRRTPAHLMREPNSMALAASARFLASVSDLDPWSFPRFGRLSTSEILQTKEDWPELSRYMADASTVKARASIPVPAHLSVIAQASRSELGTPEKINEWFDVLRSGATANPRDPRLKLRDRLMQDHSILVAATNRARLYSMIVKAWNAHAKGESVNMLAWRSDESIPRVEGFDWAAQKKES